MNPEEFDLGELIRDVVDRYHDVFKKSGYNLFVEAQTGVKGYWDR